MSQEMINLSLFFFEHVKGIGRDAGGQIDAPPTYKKMIMEDCFNLLQNKYSAKIILASMKDYKANVEDASLVYKVSDIIKHFKVAPDRTEEVKQVQENLMEAGRFYYHPALQVTPPPPTLKVNDDGTFEASYENDKYFLEMKSHFTMNELLHYFYSRTNAKDTCHPERDKGAFRFLLKHCSIDHILYTIDEAMALVEDGEARYPTSPLDLQQYLPQGKGLMEDRMNACFEEGVNYVKPRY